MADFNLRGRMTLDAGGFVEEANRASTSLNGLNKKVNTSGTAMKWFKRSIAGATIGLGAFAIKLGKDALQAAGETEKQLNRLNQILRTTGLATDSQIKALNNQANALENLGVVTASNVTIVQSQLATFDLAGSTIGKLTPAILDYITAERGANATTDEFRSLTNGLAQALNGNFASLTRVGFTIPENTKKLIKYGNESERAQAIVDTLNSTYEGFNAALRNTPEGQTRVLKNELGALSAELGKTLLPLYQQTVGIISTKVVPAFKNFIGVLKGGGIDAIINGFKFLKDNISSFASAISNMLRPAIEGFLLPAFLALFAAIGGLIRGLGMLGEFINKNIKTFQQIANTIGVAALALLAYKTTVFLVAKATGFWAFVQGKLNKALALNPIGLVVAAIVLLVAGFVKAWNSSEKFRYAIVAVTKAGLTGFASLIRSVAPFAETLLKVAAGPLRALLWGLSKLPGVGKYAKAALDSLNKGLDNVQEFGEGAADKLDAMASKLDGLKDKKINLGNIFKLPKFKVPKAEDVVPDSDGLDFGPDSLAGLGLDDKAGKAVVKNLREVIQEYNDFIEGDFAQGFAKGADTARDTIIRAVEQVKRVFEEQAKELEGKELEDFMKGFYKLNDRIREYIPQARAVAAELEQVEEDLSNAVRRLEDAQKARIEGQKKISELLREPFGEPSKLMKALDGATATVDSIIDTYDGLVEAINERFTDFEGPEKDRLLNFLNEQTTQLVALARRRVKAVEALEEAEAHLESVLEKQKAFADDVKSSLKDFASGLADLSESDSRAVIRVIKTASGLVITQMQSGMSDIDKITKQMRERLKSIQNFANNIRTLLSRGVSQTYVQSLIKAGPEAAGQTAQALATASDAQLTEINSLYGQINSVSESFGDELANTFYGNAVSMAKAFVDGARAEVDAIDAEMMSIRMGIETELNKLGLAGYNAGNDLAQQMVNALNKRKGELVALAQSIAQAIADALASAISGIGVTGASTAITSVVPTTATTPIIATDSPTTETVDNSTNIDTINLNVTTDQPIDSNEMVFQLERAFREAVFMRVR